MGRLIDEKDLLDLLKNEEWRLDEVNTVEDFKEIIDKVPTACSEFGSVEELREAKQIHQIAYRFDAFLQKDKEIFEKIEKALGFRLYSWQKSYIYTGHFRRIGSTTAECLKRLLFNDTPIDFSEKPRSMKEDCERSAMIRIYNTLQEAGIKTNPILRNRKEKESYMRGLLNERRLNNVRFEAENAKPGRGFLI